MTSERENKIYERAFQYQTDSTPLSEIIEREPDLKEWKLEYFTVAEAMPADYVMVPFDDYMIMAHDRYDCNRHCRAAEYAIYRQYDQDGNTLYDSLNYNAVYRFLMVGESTYRNMAVAIAEAVDEIPRLDEELRAIVFDMTDDDPEAELTESDAERLITEANDLGYEHADLLYPALFLEIYNSMKPEEEE